MRKFAFVIVSNRLQVTVTKSNGRISFTPSSGGVPTAIASLKHDPSNRLWIGWPGINADELTTDEKEFVTQELLTKYNSYPIFLDTHDIRLFYEGYANDTLWPLFHYFLSYIRHIDAYWQAYKEINMRYARTIARLTAPNGVIWIHDYHLMAAPAMVRKLVPKSSIGFFLHTPFPTYEIFRLLPNRKEIVEGLLGADLIGFQTHAYTQYYLNSVRRVLGYHTSGETINLLDRVVTADTFPIGIDYMKFARAADQADVQTEIGVLDSIYTKKKIILSMDRLDYSKGIVNRLEAFETFLERYPSYHKQVCLVMVAIPSRTEIQAYKELRESIEQIVSRINGKFAAIDWTPVAYQFKNLPFAQIAALFNRSDIALVTPMRDGMNLVAKEYVASRQLNAGGVLVLSEFAGAADELLEAVQINPNDPIAFVDAIHQALTMPVAEQRRRLRLMQQRIALYSVERWANDFVEQLHLATYGQIARNAKLLTGRQCASIATAFQRSSKRLLILDYDGTLAHFVSSPAAEKAAPSKSLKTLLERLARLPNTEICIISGRTRKALEAWFGQLPVTLIAEYGSFIRQDGVWVSKLPPNSSSATIAKPLLYSYAERTPGAIVEEKETSIAWHFRNVPPELAYARNDSLTHELRELLEDSNLGIYHGDKVLEIKPNEAQKSIAAQSLFENIQYDFILCAGDDSTDEDMFQSMPETAWSIKVGGQETKARYRVASIEKLRVLLQRIVDQF